MAGPAMVSAEVLASVSLPVGLEILPAVKPARGEEYGGASDGKCLAKWRDLSAHTADMTARNVRLLQLFKDS
eukprot:g15019.t1